MSTTKKTWINPAHRQLRLAQRVLTLPKRLARSLNIGPFRVSNRGVEWHDPSGSQPPVWICDRLDVIAEGRDQSGNGWSKVLKFRDRDGREREWLMPLSKTGGWGNGIVETLLDKGLTVSGSQQARRLLIEYLNTASSPTRIRTTSKIGWMGEGYALPDAWFGPKADRVLVTGVDDTHAFRAAGTLSEWQEAVCKPCLGNSRLEFAISVAFAAPMLHLMAIEGGGFHLRGATSTGKTTALRVAASVWGGGGGKGYLSPWRVTINGLEGVALAHNDALLVLDELGQMDPSQVGDAAYTLANGFAKSRSTREGTLIQGARWRTLFLSSGEVTLAEHMGSAGKVARGGQDVRFVTIEADAGQGLGVFDTHNGATSPHSLAHQLGRASDTYYGTPIRSFLGWLTQNRSKAIRWLGMLQQAFTRLNMPQGATGEVARVLDRFALVAAAGELAIQAGVLPWPKRTAARAVARCFQDWLSARGGVGSSDEALMIAQVRGFIERNGHGRFASLTDSETESGAKIGRASAIPNRAGFRWMDANQGTPEEVYFVLTEAFKNEVCRGLNASAVAQALKSRGHLVTNEPGRLTYRVRMITGLGRPRGYLVRASILQE